MASSPDASDKQSPDNSSLSLLISSAQKLSMASSPDASDKQSPHQIIELQHIAHEHLLFYRDKAHVVEQYVCDMCFEWTSTGDGYFNCKECHHFCLHKSCAERPRYIHNFLHPMHPLELFRDESNDDYKFISCRSCGDRIYSFGYKCRSSTTECDFYLDIKCATKNIFDPKDHQHLFINFKPTLFTCDACGIHEDTKCVSCICSICQVQVHQRCRRKFPLSRRVRQRLHSHVLKLCFSFQFDFDFSNKSCKICSRKMNDVLCLYQCNKKACAYYIAHVSCATSKYYLIEKIDHEEEEEVELEEIDTEPEEVITHFSHPHHSLILSNIEPTYEAGYVCHGCVRPIISAPFYTCHSQKCTFFLHKQCSQLPTTIQSPIHQHPLVLKDFLDLDVQDIIIRGFTCGACQVRCNGFAYECKYCRNKFDVECTLLGDTLNHASHEHTLTLVSTIPNEEKRCIACDSTFSDAFWCEDCNYFLDLKCAALPITIGHDCPIGTEWTVKPLKLTYNCIEHAGGQYYCDLCAETRVKDLWFYNCEDCRDSIHTECLLGDARLMYGKSYNIDGHCHSVCVTKKPKTDPLCDTCGKPCQHSLLAFCPTCKVYFHHNCCGMSFNSMNKTIRDFCCRVPSSPKDNDDDEDEDDDKEEEDAETVVEPVNHFGHPHDLIMGEYDPKRLYEEVCDGCGMQITGPFYGCADKKGKCNFFLHKECFELPKQIQHPLHPDHPLILNSFLHLPCNGKVGFICYGCDACSNRFVYTCLACKFFLDVRCSLSSATLVHESHPCTLTLIDKKKELTKGERKCQACNSDCSSCRYICDGCNFELGLQCASLPKVVMHYCYNHEWNIHPQHLMCAATDDQDGSGKYKCNRCYKPGSKKDEWYYYCKDCCRSTHVRCSDAGSPNLMKNGIEYQAYNHFHNLITVTIDDSRIKRCAVCKKRIKESSPAVYCKKCDVYFHVKCCRWLRRV